jgi:hypothetical protein
MRAKATIIVIMLVTSAVTPVPAQSCPGDLDGDSEVTVDEIIQTVNAALDGCAEPTPGFVTISSPSYNALLRVDDSITLSASANSASRTTYTWRGSYRRSELSTVGFLLIGGGKPTISWKPGPVPCPGIVVNLSVSASSADGHFGEASVPVYVECTH